MQKNFLFSLIFIFCVHSLCFSQPGRYSLKIRLSDTQSGYAKLMIIGVYSNKDSARHWAIEKAEATVQGVVPQLHPYLAFIWVNDSMLTGNFVLLPGHDQELQLNELQFGALPLDTSILGRQNKILNEKLAFIDQHETAVYFSRRSKLIKNVYQGHPPQSVLDSLKIALDKISFKKDSTIKNFIVQYPDSYVGLLYLNQRVRIRGYSPELNSALKSLNSNLQQSDLGIKTKNIFDKAKRVAIGSSFPKIQLSDGNNKIVSYDLSRLTEVHPKLLLIDFWYSNCGPCIAQFGKLKQLFKKYHDKGFDINSISTDASAKIGAWKSVVSKYALPWDQYLDINGAIAKDLNINTFPFNFLIDENGNILKKHISMVELEEILKNECKDNSI
ncbi:Thiol-disulfide isomerase or thioredoxin [Arachidicoccus rhizosphaerae]|uniref:Thiol-disulfide isomerase or thioredoxin n=1 Tax=Arachidicoccus rhizosphaerae TaxID=551991 RepID=A0A1H4A594_9BACT|nr:TlpA disulfide reductase family protein [Arachidicoccus rhizosphaerae]SEA31145.1 Thiol-disulfide isomerase or thioredoxin [Arachidicoccus rhizosphaerae]